MTRPNPVRRKPHIVCMPDGRWVAKLPSRMGALRGYGRTADEAHSDLMQRYAAWQKRAERLAKGR